jgi:hypothetical protein
MSPRFVCILMALAAAPAAWADCSTAGSGARCLTVDTTTSVTTFAPGDELPAGQYFVLLNTEYYGLPPAEAGWRYYRVDRRVLRVETDTRAVLEDVTHATNAAW